MQKLALFYPEGHEAHCEQGHPERPERIEAVRQAIEEAGWWVGFKQVSPLPMNLEFLCRIHDSGYLGYLQRVCQAGGYLDQDTYTTPASWQLALNAAGGTCAVADVVWRSGFEKDPINLIRRGFVLGRPPGHHAERQRGMGFCLINNVAAAAEHLISSDLDDVDNAERVAIVDLDLHHGNGTQDIFYQRRDVFFISTHQSPLYPGTGKIEEVGEGTGKWHNLNIPFPPGTGDTGYLAAMDELILPMLDRYKPQIVFISAGFDPHWRDPLGYLLVSARGYGLLIQRLVRWSEQNCQGRIVLEMEGGYDTLSIKACALASIAALTGEQIEDPIGLSPRPEGKSWQAVVREIKSLWQL